MAVTVLGSCTGSSQHDNKHSACRNGCRGVLDKAAYDIRVPANWNGTLLLYSHGYRADQGNGPGTAPLTAGDPGTGTGGPTAALLAEGYALAGSAYATAGWAVSGAVRDADRLYHRFVQQVGKPKRVYAWGTSMGGLVTELVAERYGWVTGAAPTCGVVAGPTANADNMLEAVVATQALFGVRLTGATAVATVQRTVVQAAQDTQGDGPAKLLYLSALLGLADQARGSTGNLATDPVQVAALNLAAYVDFALGLLPELTRRFGGSPAEAVGPDARSALSAAQRAAVLDRHGNPDAYAATVRQAPTGPVDARARRAFIASGNPTGRLRVPTITLHTVADPYALASNETVLRARVAAAGRLDRLAQFYVAPPASSGPAPYGVGHCAFSVGQTVALLDTLDRWVRSGHRPSAASVVGELRPALAAHFTAPRFPTDAR